MTSSLHSPAFGSGDGCAMSLLVSVELMGSSSGVVLMPASHGDAIVAPVRVPGPAKPVLPSRIGGSRAAAPAPFVGSPGPHRARLLSRSMARRGALRGDHFLDEPLSRNWPRITPLVQTLEWTLT